MTRREGIGLGLGTRSRNLRETGANKGWRRRWGRGRWNRCRRSIQVCRCIDRRSIRPSCGGLPWDRPALPFPPLSCRFPLRPGLLVALQPLERGRDRSENARQRAAQAATPPKVELPQNPSRGVHDPRGHKLGMTSGPRGTPCGNPAVPAPRVVASQRLGELARGEPGPVAQREAAEMTERGKRRAQRGGKRIEGRARAPRDERLEARKGDVQRRVKGVQKGRGRETRRKWRKRKRDAREMRSEWRQERLRFCQPFEAKSPFSASPRLSRSAHCDAPVRTSRIHAQQRKVSEALSEPRETRAEPAPGPAHLLEREAPHAPAGGERRQPSRTQHGHRQLGGNEARRQRAEKKRQRRHGSNRGGGWRR